MSNAVGKLRDVVEAVDLDPREALQKAFGDVKFQPMHCQVLVATHPGKKFHQGTSILRTDTSLLEARYQGNVFLVIAVGPGAFVDGPGANFYGFRPKVGDWVVARPSDGLEMLVNKLPCRVFDDSNIKGIVDDPEAFW